jgi:chemotaxis-related protein WspB
MLFLLLQLGPDRYAIAARDVVEVLPLVEIKRLPQTPPEIAGLFTYRGAPVPLLDLCQLAYGVPARARLSTRILLVNCQQGRLLGLIAEGATAMLRCEPAAPWLGPVIRDERGIVQRIEWQQLLTPALRERLYDGLPA